MTCVGLGSHIILSRPMKRILALLIASSFSMAATPASAKPLRVFIMAGQSNMEGHANVETFKFQL